MATFMMAGSARVVFAVTTHQPVQKQTLVVDGAEGGDDPNGLQNDP